MIKKLFANITAQKQAERRAELYRNLIRHEARIGGQLFGPVASGGRREFFCLDEHTWVWHEEWVDQNGQHQSKTTRYDVRPSGILKSQNGQYQNLSPDEGRNLYEAIVAYEQRVMSELYSFAL
jgi:hypothetical protein